MVERMEEILENRQNVGEDIINIVVIEDDDGQIDLYRDAIEENNLDKDSIEINAIFLKNGDNLDNILNNNRIDTIIVDLNLGSDDINNSGNDIIEKVYMNKRIPIMVISGNLNRLRERREITDVYRQYTRSEIEFYEVISEIKKIYLSGYTRIFGHPGKIDKLLNDVFWKYASTNIETWCINDNIELKDRRFMRFITARMNEQLHYYKNNHDLYNSIEFYISPPNSDCFFNGDIVLFENVYYLVMTPSCDIENNKVDEIMLCEIKFDQFRQLRDKIRTNLSNTTKNKLRDLINNKDKNIHFLPPTVFFEGGIVDFSSMRKVSIGVFEERKVLKYRISQIFMKDIINRFSLFLRSCDDEELCSKADYFSKQGQPAIDLDEIVKIVLKEESN